MKYVAEFQVNEGSVLVEIDEPSVEGHAVKVTSAGDLVVRAKESLEKGLEKVMPAAEVVLRRLQALNLRPDEISIDFGIKLSAEAGAIVASTAGEANFQVALKWKPTPKTSP